MERDQARVSTGRIGYHEFGEGPPIVFVHGLLVNRYLWRNVVPPLADRFRCLVPELPLGSHGLPLSADADLSPPGVAEVVVEFMDALDLDAATIVGNDTGGAISQLLVADYPERAERLVLTNSDAFDNFLPMRFRYLQYAARLPGSLLVLAQLLRSRAVARGPLAYGPLSISRIPDRVLDEYTTPIRADTGVRRDLRKVLAGITPRYTRAAAEAFPDFESPVLLAWGADDPLFPLAHARLLRALFPDARLVEIERSGAFVPEDRPQALAEAVETFLDGTG